MNFLDGSKKTSDAPKMQCVTIIKFRDNVRFALDDVRVREEIGSRFSHLDDLRAVKGKAVLIELASGMRQEEEFSLSFVGFFKQHIEGRIWVPDGMNIKEYDKYVKHKPYVLIFNYDDLMRFEYRKAD